MWLTYGLFQHRKSFIAELAVFVLFAREFVSGGARLPGRTRLFMTAKGLQRLAAPILGAGLAGLVRASDADVFGISQRRLEIMQGPGEVFCIETFLAPLDVGLIEDVPRNRLAFPIHKVGRGFE